MQCRPIHSCPKQCVSKNLDGYTRDKLRQLMQGWDNRLVLEREPFVEAYIKGRARRYWSLCNDATVPERGILEAFGSRVILDQESQAMGRRFQNAFIVACHKDVETCRPRMGEQEPVFVRTVKMVKLDEWIPSTIRFYLVKDQIGDVRGDALYYSKMFLAYQRCGTHIDRKVQIVRRVFKGGDDGICETIECTSQIVNGIARHHLQEGHTGEELLPVNRDLDAHPLSVRIILDGDEVRACLVNEAERFFDISDVLVGPFDLSYCAVERVPREF